MRIKTIYYSSHFQRTLKKLPDFLQSQLNQKELIFRRNPLDPRLKTHKLSSKSKNLWSFSITYSHRVIFKFIKSDAVGFIEIGDHSIYQ